MATYLTRCPKALITEESMFLLEQYSYFKALGHLPYAGGLYDQPAYLMQAFKFCDETINALLADDEYIKVMSKRRKNKCNSHTCHSSGNIHTLADVLKVKKTG